MKKFTQIGLALLVATMTIFILLISAFEFAMYSDFDFYQMEYEKYEVTDDLSMEMKDVMHVTKEMMAYLRGEREELSVITTIDGVEKDFFNEQDRFHMNDVKNLFVGGLFLRTIAIILTIGFLFILVMIKAPYRRWLPLAFEIMVVVFLALVGLLAFFFMRDFTTAFTIFHEIFFSNDLWMFDPATDYMIRMLPESFFFDMAFRIGARFLGALLVLLAVCVIVQVSNKKENKKSL